MQGEKISGPGSRNSKIVVAIEPQHWFFVIPHVISQGCCCMQGESRLAGRTKPIGISTINQNQPAEFFRLESSPKALAAIFQHEFCVAQSCVSGWWPPIGSPSRGELPLPVGPWWQA